MAKDPSPKADALRAMREANFEKAAAAAPRPLVPYAGNHAKRGKKPKGKKT